jgi:hypothetical protein
MDSGSDTTYYEVEYCTNEEWLVVYGGYPFPEDTEASELSSAGLEIVQRELELAEEIEEIDLVPARGQRLLCDGWNGAQFSWRCGQFGTFEDLPAELRNRLESIVGS